MYQQDLTPIGGSLTASALVAMLPLVTIFVLLGVLKLKAQWAALASLLVALVVAIAVYGMPVGMAVSSAAEGAVFGFFPILWIVINAIWIYNMTVETGHFEVLRRAFGSISRDQRIQAVIIAFCFGGLLEALAGFGTPVAISSVMLLGLGLRPLKAATVALVANTAPVAFGALATPIVTMAGQTGFTVGEIGGVVGRQTPVLAVFVPLVLVFLVDGSRGLRETWIPALLAGVTFSLAQYLCANFFVVELTDIVASLVAAGAIVALLRVWQPPHVLAVDDLDEQEQQARMRSATATAHRVEAGGERGGRGHDHDAALVQGTSGSTFGTQVGGRSERGAGEPVASGLGATEGPGPRREAARHQDSPSELFKAFAPYLMIILVLGISQIPAVKDALASTTVKFAWPGLDILGPSGKAPSSATFTLNWLAAAGSLVLISGLLTIPILGLGFGKAVKAYVDTYVQLKWAIVTVMGVLALAYVMNLSGQTLTIGQWMAGAGSLFALLSPVLGWLGVAVTGSDTSSNALFGTLQVAAANNSGMDPLLAASANTSGGVLGKMISPQNLAIACGSVGLAGQEGVVFRKVVLWSLGFLVAMALLVYLQSTSVLGWMV